MEKEIQLSFDFQDEIGGDTDTGRSVETKSEMNIPAKEKDDIRERAIRKKIRVTFADGTVFCDKSPTQTMIKTIEHIGIDKVRELGIEVCHIPLISDKIVPRYEEWTKPIGDGLYIMTQADAAQKYCQLLSIKMQLNLECKIEMGDDFATTSNDGHHGFKKKKATLKVSFGDGTVIKGTNMNEVYLRAVSHIGIDKIVKADISVFGKNLITQSKKYNNQQPLYTGQWLTTPNSTKDKYKALRVIAAMMHVKMDTSLSND